MKPLLIVISFNRMRETMATMRSLRRTGALDEAEAVAFDNGSTDGTAASLWKMVTDRDDPFNFAVVMNPSNVGCPRALNTVMEMRRLPGQAVIKVDNDVELLTPGWVGTLVAFVEAHPEFALVSPWYEGIADGRAVVRDGGDFLEVYPLVGHCVYHAGAFLDAAGYFDVLAEDHLYGFEDLLMCRRATKRGFSCGVVKGVRLRHLQRHSGLDVAAGMGTSGEGRTGHVRRMRPLYEARLRIVHERGESYRVGEDGKVENGG